MGVTYSGGCLCGRVRYSAAAEPIYVCHCHCRSCQRAAGAAVVAWATFAAADVEIGGDSMCWYDSSPGRTRGHCAICGTSLTFADAGRPLEIDITAASLDEPARVSPRSHIWLDDRVPWQVIGDDLPRFRRKVTG